MTPPTGHTRALPAATAARDGGPARAGRGPAGRGSAGPAGRGDVGLVGRGSVARVSRGSVGPAGRAGGRGRPGFGGSGRRPAGPAPRAVRARFRLADAPGVTVTPVRGAGPAAAAAHRALVQAGFGHLGGHLRLAGAGPAPRGRDLARAARRAVAAALATRPRPGDPYRG